MAVKDGEGARRDVIIVGGGPVGMGLAIELGQRGVRCCVVERHVSPQQVPKGQNLTQRSGEHFRAWGVAEQIRRASPIPHSFGSAGLTAYGSLLGGHHYDWFRRAEVRRFYAADNERLPQYLTEGVLRRRVVELEPVDTLYGWSGTAVAQDDDGVSVTISNDDTGETRSVKGSYAVGCDGSRSVIRDAAGIAQEIEPHGKRMVLLVFNSTELHDLLQRFPGKSYFNVLNPDLDGYWQFLGRVDLEGNWFFHAPVSPETTKDNFDFAGYLHGAIGAEFAVTFEHIGFWDLRIATAKSYRNGRVFIAGDAAHSHPPYGGFGINTGFEDARNLGWKIAAALQGWAGPKLLDSYDDERRPVFLSTAEDFIGRMIRDDRAFLEQFDLERDRTAFEAEWARRASGGNADVVGFSPHYEGSPIVWGPENGRSSAVGRHEYAARAGRHLAPRSLSTGGTTFDALGNGLSLLDFGSAPSIADRFRDAAASLRVPLAVIADDAAEERADYACRYLLVRPDNFIAWAGDAASPDPTEILKKAVGI